MPIQLPVGARQRRRRVSSMQIFRYQVHHSSPLSTKLAYPVKQFTNLLLHQMCPFLASTARQTLSLISAHGRPTPWRTTPSNNGHIGCSGRPTPLLIILISNGCIFCSGMLRGPTTTTPNEHQAVKGSAQGG